MTSALHSKGSELAVLPASKTLLRQYSNIFDSFTRGIIGFEIEYLNQ